MKMICTINDTRLQAVNLEDLEPGEWFTASSTSGKVYIKVDYHNIDHVINAVDLCGIPHNFGPAKKVYRLRINGPVNFYLE